MERINYLYLQYLNEMNYHPTIPALSLEDFTKLHEEQLSKLQYVEAVKGEKMSFLYYDSYQEQGITYYNIPLFGYYASSEEMMVRAFQNLASCVKKNQEYIFNVNLYAHDLDAIQAYHMMQFGIQSEKGIVKLENIDVNNHLDIKVLSKEELTLHWNEVWHLTYAIIQHLQTSPVFYPGNEFTEDVYKEFFFDEATDVIVAIQDKKLVGLIEINEEASELLNDSSCNVGEIYVIPELRKSGLSTALLYYAMNLAIQKGYQYMWLEHGTANPNARGFWNRYFDTYSYNLTRNILYKGE